MKNKKQYFIAISTTNFSIHLCKSKTSLAKAINCNRTNLLSLKERSLVKEWLVVTATIK